MIVCGVKSPQTFYKWCISSLIGTNSFKICFCISHNLSGSWTLGHNFTNKASINWFEFFCEWLVCVVATMNHHVTIDKVVHILCQKYLIYEVYIAIDRYTLSIRFK